MSKNFQKCLKIVLHHEGIDPDSGKTGWVQHPSDNDGGATNYGITRITYADFVEKETNEVSIEEMRNMPYSDVELIYKHRYWDRIKGTKIAKKSLGMALFCFDFSVNAGTRRGAKTLQRACGASPDGIIGKKTLAVALRQDPDYIIRRMHEIRQAFYESLESKFKVFGKGWTRRNKEVLETAQSLG